MPPKQSPLSSLVESIFNSALGVVIAMGATALICYLYNIELSLSNNFVITSWMTGFSVVRNYVVRRLWNMEFWKR